MNIMKKLLILLIVCTSGIYSCKNAVTRKYGITEPKIETIRSITAELRGYSADFPSYLCVFRDSAALVDWFRHKNMPGRSQFYNSSGFRIITQDSLFCSKVEADFAGNLKPDKIYRIDSSVIFEHLRKNIIPLGEKADTDPSKYSFTCVIFWAKFMGKVNEASMDIARSAMRSRPAVNGKVNLLFVNMDMLDTWNVSENMIRMDMKKR